MQGKLLVILLCVYFAAQIIDARVIFNTARLRPSLEVLETLRKINTATTSVNRDLDDASRMQDNNIRKAQLEFQVLLSDFDFAIKSANLRCALDARKARILLVREFDGIKRCAIKTDVRLKRKDVRDQMNGLKKQCLAIDYFCRVVHASNPEEVKECLTDKLEEMDNKIKDIASIDMDKLISKDDCITNIVTETKKTLNDNMKKLDECVNPTTTTTTTTTTEKTIPDDTLIEQIA